MTALAIVLICLWYVPHFIRMKEKKAPLWRYATALLLGAVPAFLLAAYSQIGLDGLLKQLSWSWLAKSAVKSIVFAGMLEELIKFLAAKATMIQLKNCSKAETMLLFGAVGLGFELTETILTTETAVTALLRGIFAIYLFCQYDMGRVYDQFPNNKKAYLKLFGLPMMVHGFYDFSLDLLSYSITKMNSFSLEVVGCIVLFVIIQTFCLIFIIRTNRRLSEEISNSNQQ